MSTITALNLVLLAPETPAPAVDLLTATRSAAAVAALVSLQPDLVALDADDVFAPGGSVRRVASRALRLVGEGREHGSHDHASLARLESLALALLRAQHELLWPSTLEIVADYDRLVRRAERRFHDLDHLVRHLVRRGKISRASLPRCRRMTFVDRCERAILWVAVLRDHDVHEVRVDLWETKALAWRLLHARPQMPDELPPRELRDRAYTALCHALSEHERERHVRPSLLESGVFPIDDREDASFALAA